MTLGEKLRLMQVKRYPITHTNRDQSVAEHSFNVLLIATELAGVTGNPVLINAVMRYAVDHDMEEVYTGDIPSSFKRQLRAKCPEVVSVLDNGFDAPSMVKAIVKLADCIEAIYYLREFGGSRLSETVKRDILANFKNICDNSEAPEDVINKARKLAWNL